MIAIVFWLGNSLVGHFNSAFLPWTQRMIISSLVSVTSNVIRIKNFNLPHSHKLKLWQTGKTKYMPTCVLHCMICKSIKVFTMWKHTDIWYKKLLHLIQNKFWIVLIYIGNTSKTWLHKMSGWHLLQHSVSHWPIGLKRNSISWQENWITRYIPCLVQLLQSTK